MGTTDLLMDAFERIRDGVHPTANGLNVEELSFRPDVESNSIAWLVWHLTRIQDDHVAHLRGDSQRWLEAGWAERFALPPATFSEASDPRSWQSGSAPCVGDALL